MNPNCPTHGLMGESKFGGWYCSKKAGNGWCNYAAYKDGRVYQKTPKGQNSTPTDKSPHQRDPGASSAILDAKGDAMGRNNIAHAAIRAGLEPTWKNLVSCETWFQWSRGKMPHVTPKIVHDEELPPF